MQQPQSSSGMIFREINQENTPQKNMIKNPQKKASNDLRKNSSISKSGKDSQNKQNQSNEQKQLQVTGQSFFIKGKRQNSLIVNFQKANESTQQNQSNEIKLVNLSLNENKRVNGSQNLRNLFSHEPYIKRLLNQIQVSNYNISTIHRQNNLFSTSISMNNRNGQQLLKYVKRNRCLGNEYEIISQNLRQNILGSVKTNFWGSRFDVYEKSDQCEDQKLTATIYYSDEFGLASTTRSVEIYLIRGQSKQTLSHHETYLKDSLKMLYEQGDQRIIKLINKQPTKNENSQYFLDFSVDGVLSSVKNVILVEQKTGKQSIKFYKVSQNDFQLKISQNVSVFTGYCFAFSSLVFKLLACQ